MSEKKWLGGIDAVSKIALILNLIEDIFLRFAILFIAVIAWGLLLFSMTYSILTTPVKGGYKGAV